jgi:O-antigen ligase
VLSETRKTLAPVYLFACLILGGSAQGIWQNMILQIAGIAIIAWSAGAGSGDPLSRPARQLLLIAGLGIAIVGLQMVPLPASVWPNLGPRGMLADGYRVLGLAVPAQPLSVTPAETLNSLLGIIPPLAIFCAMVRLKAYRPLWMAGALLAGTVAGILIGALQVASSAGPESGWYLYSETNYGTAVGFFANVNHMATLLVITLPFVAAMAASGKRENMQRYSAILALTAGAALVIVVGLALNGSLAGYGLALPVIAASLLIVLPSNSRLRIWAVLAAGLLLIAALAALEATSIGSSRIGQDATTSVQSREQIFSTTEEAIHDFMPWGSGLGSFRQVYQLYEHADRVTNEYVIHAHNDYVELALELGLAGIVVMLLFLAWWAVAVWRVWRSAEAGPYARAAAIASAAILAHSLVDFPLRTAAIAACFGMCLALLADRRAPVPRESSELRPARHVVFR